MVIKASTNNATKYFHLDGLDYEKGVYTLFYDSVIKSSAGALDEDLVRIGIKNNSDSTEILQSPLLVTDWNNGSSFYSDFDTFIAAATELVAPPSSAPLCKNPPAPVHPAPGGPRYQRPGRECRWAWPLGRSAQNARPRPPHRVPLRNWNPRRRRLQPNRFRLRRKLPPPISRLLLYPRSRRRKRNRGRRRRRANPSLQHPGPGKRRIRPPKLRIRLRLPGHRKPIR